MLTIYLTPISTRYILYRSVQDRIWKPLSMSSSISQPSFLSIAAAILAVTSVGVGLSLSIPLLSILFEQRGISSLWIGLSTAMAGLGAILAGPFVTPIAQKIGVVPALISFLLISATSLASLYLVTDFVATFP